MTDAAPERRGDWGGLTQRAPGCMRVVGEPEYVPVCPLCAKALMHTRAEHDQLERLATRGAPRYRSSR